MNARSPQSTLRQRANVLLLLPALLILGIFFVLPYLNLFYMSFLTNAPGTAYVKTFTFENYHENLTDRFIWRVIWQTLRFGFITTLVTLILSYPLAYHMARASSRSKGFLMIMLLAPLLTGIIIRSYGWMIILGDNGLINQYLKNHGIDTIRLMYNRLGVMIGLVHVYMPFMVLSILGSLQAIDPDVERAARSLGAGSWRTAQRIIWPLSLPGVTSGCVLVFVLTVSSYVIPSLLGGYRVLTIPLLVVQTVQELFDWPAGSALALMFFVITIGIVALFLRLMDRAMRGLR